MGMGLEFIDISREEDIRDRANGTTGSRRAPGKGRPQPVRQDVSRTIRYENQRGRRSKEQGQVSAQTQRTRRTRPAGQRMYPELEGRRREYNARSRYGNSGRNNNDNRLQNENRNRDNNRYGNSSNRSGSRERSRNYAGYNSPRGNSVRRVRPVDPRVQKERMRRRKIHRQRVIAAKMTVLLGFVCVIFLSGFTLYKLIDDFTKSNEPQQTFNSYTPTVERREVIKANETNKPIITEDFLTVNEYSRPGEKLGKVKNIFVHYTANPGTSAAQNRSYFENLGITGETSASAHFVIGYDGEIIQCIPLEEIAYAVMQRNYDSISIECCYLSEDGKFTDATYQSLLRLSAWLLKEYKLAPDDMRRHYDEGGKKCPLYYVEHEEAWEKFLSDLEQYIMNNQV